jgi:hypothetical protein
VPEAFLLPVWRLWDARSDLISLGSSDVGVRLNTYTDSIGPARALGPCPADLNRLARAAIQRRGPVQKHSQFTHPLSIQVADGCRVIPCGTPRLQFFVEG